VCTELTRRSRSTIGERIWCACGGRELKEERVVLSDRVKESVTFGIALLCRTVSVEPLGYSFDI
jgi:hypothetical protein